jgi:acyl-CoA synthetase (AMP-forming)/AMP-acid ligase II
MNVREHTLYERIVENARLHGNKPAFTFKDQSLSFREYLKQVNQLSHGLTRAGLKRGDRLAVLMDNNLEYPLIYGACAQTGIIAVGLNIRASAEEMKLFLKNIGPKMLFFEKKYEEAAGMLQNYLSMNHLVSADPTALDATLFKDFIDTITSSNLPSQKVKDAPGQEDGYMIIPTAAVDGIPKGALLSQRNILISNMLSITEYGKENIECYLALLPLFHVAGLTGTWATFHVGGHTVLMEKFEPTQVVDLVEKHQLTYFGSFPPILENVLNAAKAKGSRLPSLKMVTGLEFGPAIIERLYEETQAEFWVGFGQTETSGFVSTCPFKEHPGSAGRPSVCNSIAIIDEAGRPVAPGEEGEIVVRGENIFLEYWGDEDATQYTLRNGWHHCGDIGKMDEEGYLWYVKPKAEKELIKTGGENVYPAEVEVVLSKHPAIERCAVIGTPDKRWGIAVKAVCQLKAGATLTLEEVSGFVGSQIAGYKKPRYAEFVENIPEKDGKVDRDKVKEFYG